MGALALGDYRGSLFIEKTEYSAEGHHYYPLLNLNLTLDYYPLKVNGNFLPYSLIEVTGQLFLNNEPLSCSLPYFAFVTIERERSGSYNIYLQFPLDLKRIERIEQIRRGKDISFTLTVNGIALIGNTQQSFYRNIVNISSIDAIRINIPQSDWVGKILPRWDYGQVKLVEIYFPETYEHEVLKKSYQHIERAISHFNNGNDRETLAFIYFAFEAIAKSFGCESPDQNFFSKFLENIENDKKEKLKLLLDKFCNYLHLGRHEPNKPLASIERRDSEFALTMAQLIYSYLSKVIPREGK